MGKKKSEAKMLCQSRNKKFPGGSSQYIQTGSSPSCLVITPEPPPRGKRAFLCGVTYKKQKCELKGTAQDVKNMRDLLVDQFSFPIESILILAGTAAAFFNHHAFSFKHVSRYLYSMWNTFVEEELYKPPTRKNIEDGFKWLVSDIQPGDSLVFYFAGHGLRQRDLNGDEIDGFDESICPVDFETNGMVLDNYINEVIVRPLIPDVRLHAIVDSCHSGTILDLPHVYDINTYVYF